IDRPAVRAFTLLLVVLADIAILGSWRGRDDPSPRGLGSILSRHASGAKVPFGPNWGKPGRVIEAYH
ncbi:MAG: hypothetical protein ACREDL_19255, partial [Bradyrhizobium sp.]